MGCRIVGCGSYLPAHVLTNEELEQSINTTSEWIKTRTGILQRHISAKDEYASDMALEASYEAIADAGILAHDIDLIIFATTTPDNAFPSSASKLQSALGCNEIPAFDIQAVCSGFIYGLHIAHALMKASNYKTVLLVASEKMSSLLDWEDRTTCILFGDGAGAVILKKDDSINGIIDSKINCDGSKYDILHTNLNGSLPSAKSQIHMNGKEVFRHAVEKMSESLDDILASNNLTTKEIDYFIPHQANARIISSIANKFNLPASKIVQTIESHANCSAASIPLALAQLNKVQKLKKGDLILMSAFGSGATWGSAILRW